MPTFCVKTPQRRERRDPAAREVASAFNASLGGEGVLALSGAA